MALLVRVHATGEFTFAPSTDRDLDLGVLHKAQQDLFSQYVQTRHPLPQQLQQRMERTNFYHRCPGRCLWHWCCLCACESRSWDMDRDPDELLQHIRGQLTGILEKDQYELLEHIDAKDTHLDGRAVLKLWLRDPSRYEA